jgi:hypothetical protein
MFRRQSNLTRQMGIHCLMGVCLGMTFLIVVLAADIWHVCELMNSSGEPVLIFFLVVFYVIMFFGGGATITGAVLEAIETTQ